MAEYNPLGGAVGDARKRKAEAVAGAEYVPAVESTASYISRLCRRNLELRERVAELEIALRAATVHEPSRIGLWRLRRRLRREGRA